MLPTAGVPFLTHLLQPASRRPACAGWCCRTSYRAEVFADHFGAGADGSGWSWSTSPRTTPLGTGGGIRNVAGPGPLRRRAGLQRRRAVRGRPGQAGRDAPGRRRRRHPAPDPGRGPAGVRLGADRRRRAGCRRSWRSRRSRSPTRSTPAATSSAASVLDVDPGRAAGLGRAGDVPRAAGRRRGRARLRRLDVLAGSGHAGRRSCAAAPTWCSGIAPTAALPGPARAGRWCCRARPWPPDAALTGGTTVGAGCDGRGRAGWTRRCCSTAPGWRDGRRGHPVGGRPRCVVGPGCVSRTRCSATGSCWAPATSCGPGPGSGPACRLGDGAVRFSSDA